MQVNVTVTPPGSNQGDCDVRSRTVYSTILGVTFVNSSCPDEVNPYKKPLRERHC